MRSQGNRAPDKVNTMTREIRKEENSGMDYGNVIAWVRANSFKCFIRCPGLKRVYMFPLALGISLIRNFFSILTQMKAIYGRCDHILDLLDLF